MKSLIKSAVFLILIITSTFNCSEDIPEETYTLERTNDSIYIQLSNNELNYTLLNQYFTANDTDYIAILNYKLHAIYIYNLEKQLLSKKIKVERDGPNGFGEIFGFKFINKDSFVLAGPATSLVGIYGKDDEIKKKISIAKDLNGNNIFPYLLSFTSVGKLDGHQLYMLQMLAANPEIKLSADEVKKNSVMLSVDLISGEVNKIPLSYPVELAGKDLYGCQFGLAHGHHNCSILFGTNFSDIFVSENFESFKKIPIETKYQLKMPEHPSKYIGDFEANLTYTEKHDMFLNLLYDKYRELYYIVIRKRQTELSKDPLARDWADCYIVILDKNFKHLGDVYFPDNTYSFENIFITKDGVYISEDAVENPSYDVNAMRYRLFKLRKQPAIKQ